MNQDRWKSPVVWTQVVAAVVTCAVFFFPQFDESIQMVAGTITALISIFSAANNPTDKEGF